MWLIRATATLRPCFCSLPDTSDLEMTWAVGRESAVRIIGCMALTPRTQMGQLEAGSLPSLGGSL